MNNVMNIKDIRIVFMGTPEISAHLLEHIILSGFNIVGLVSQPDKLVGRKNILEKTPTKIVAEKYNIPVFQPLKIRKDFSFLDETKPDLILTLAYGQIVPIEVIDYPKYKCLNFHGSILPKYRGASPIQTSLINSDEETGITLMEMTEKMDAGDIYMIEKVKIESSDNCSSLFNKMGKAAIRLFDKALPLYLEGKLDGVSQDECLVTYCSIIKPEEEKINFELEGKKILGWIKALSDQPGAYLILDNQKIKIFKAELLPDCNGRIGEIIKADKFGLHIKLKDSVLSVLELQKEGKKRMDYKSFLNGNNSLLNKITF